MRRNDSLKNRALFLSCLLVLSLVVFFSSGVPRAVADPYIFEDGFETGDFSKWTTGGGTPSVTSGDAHHGTYKAVLDESGEFEQVMFTSVDYCFMRAYVMFKSFPAAGWETQVFGLYNTSAPSVYMSEAKVINIAGTVKWKLLCYNNGVSVSFTSEQQKPVLDTWYCVEVESKSNSDTDAEARIYIDGNELTDVSRTGLNNTRTINSAYIAETVTGGVIQWYDCVAVDTGYIGPEPLEDGFESGDFSRWNGVFTTSGETAAVVDTEAYDGVYSGMFTGGSGSGWEGAYSYVTMLSASELYARGYFKVTSSGLADNNDRFFFMIFFADGDPVAYAGWWNVSGVVKWALLTRHGTSWIVAFSETSPMLDQWYCVELHWVADSAVGLGELYVNDRLFSSISGRNTAAFGDVDFMRFGLAELYYCAATTVYGDNFAASETYVGPDLPVPLEDGFESGDFSRWNGAFTTSGETATVVDTEAYGGVYSGMFTGGSGSGWEGAYSYVTIPSASELYARGYFKVTSSGLADHNDRFFFMIFFADGNPVAYAGWWRVNDVVKWALLTRHGTSWIVAFSETSPMLDQWYSVELHWVSDSVAGIGELYVDGDLFSSISGRNTAAFGDVDFMRFGLAELYYCGATTVYGDNFAASETYVGPEL